MRVDKNHNRIVSVNIYVFDSNFGSSSSFLGITINRDWIVIHRLSPWKAPPTVSIVKISQRYNLTQFGELVGRSFWRSQDDSARIMIPSYGVYSLSDKISLDLNYLEFAGMACCLQAYNVYLHYISTLIRSYSIEEVYPFAVGTFVKNRYY